ncbi:MAG: GDSL-like Lipase/Acylhydrolase family protein [Bacteriophage sp.]|nr:MAG: GDSL-like Lipase/Acylhydrolase family protein [Bacteriophage sp.]
MAVREYVGSRYVPLFADPIEWNDKRTYEPLTIVEHKGNSYTSRQFVPLGIDISNKDFWALTGNYNAQVEQYRQEVLKFDKRINDNAQAIVNLRNDTEQAIGNLKNDTEQAIANLRNDTEQAIGNLKGELLSKKHMVLIGDSYTNPAVALGNTPLWWEYVCKNLNVVAHNYAKGGAGYQVKGNLFSTQVAKAVADASYDHKMVEYCVVYGGINDIGQITATMVQNVYDALQKEFVNAKVVIALNAGQKNQRNHSNNRRTLVRDMVQSGIDIFSTAGIELFIDTVDTTHPSTEGNKILGAYLTSKIGGTGFSYVSTAQGTIAPISGNVLGNPFAIFENDVIKLNAAYEVTKGKSTVVFPVCPLAPKTFADIEYIPLVNTLGTDVVGKASMNTNADGNMVVNIEGSASSYGYATFTLAVV